MATNTSEQFGNDQCSQFTKSGIRQSIRCNISNGNSPNHHGFLADERSV
jgi:hypothetical protein